MKRFLYSFYALIFNICVKLFKIKKNRVCFVSMHNENFNDCLGGVYREMKKNPQFEFVFITREDLHVSVKNVFKVISFFFNKSRLLATSEFVFLNDNFLPMGKMNFHTQASVCQLWHGEGAFKKFGLAINQDSFTRSAEINANKRLTSVVCTSKNVVGFYAEAFGVDEKIVFALGSARVDYFYKEQNKQLAIDKLHEIYPQTIGKKVILYAPTFRDDPKKNSVLLSNFDFAKFEQELSSEYVLLVRLHPQIPADKVNMHCTIDATDYKDVRELVLSCDVLITDYSSIAMDFSLVNKKTIYFAYDLEDYIKDRDFYLEYTSFVSGEVARTTDEVIGLINKPMNTEKNEKFKNFNFDYQDSNNAKRIVDKIVYGKI